MTTLARGTQGQQKQSQIRDNRFSIALIWAIALSFAAIGFSAAPQAQTAPAPGLTQVEPLDPGASAAIQETIIGQIAAFQSDDGALALTFAVPRARDVWRTPEEFLTMVRQGYEAIYRPDEFSFEAAIAQGGVAVQLVKIRGQSGKTFLAQYEMHRQTDGKWLIGGVRAVEIEANEQTL